MVPLVVHLLNGILIPGVAVTRPKSLFLPYRFITLADEIIGLARLDRVIYVREIALRHLFQVCSPRLRLIPQRHTSHSTPLVQDAQWSPLTFQR